MPNRTGTSCWKCHGLLLVVDQMKDGYTTYVQCPVCRGSGDATRPKPVAVPHPENINR